MPTISVFLGIIVKMMFDDHNPPHIHVEYQGHKAIIDIASGEILRGSLPTRQLKFVVAWVEFHKDELLANWELCKNLETPVKIKPLEY